jgi:hypothetical protein
MRLPHLYEQPHRRFNPLTREWVLVSPHRTQRPWQDSWKQLLRLRPTILSVISVQVTSEQAECATLSTTRPSYSPTQNIAKFLQDISHEAYRSRGTKVGQTGGR